MVELLKGRIPDSRQKHAKLYSDLLQVLKREPLIALGSQQRGFQHFFFFCVRGTQPRDFTLERRLLLTLFGVAAVCWPVAAFHFAVNVCWMVVTMSSMISTK